MDNLYCDIHPLEGESFVDAVVRTIPLRKRSLMGLALKKILLRLREANGQATEMDLLELQNCTNEFDRINSMTDEEYELEELK